jgi:hypothetical protein
MIIVKVILAKMSPGSDQFEGVTLKNGATRGSAALFESLLYAAAVIRSN